MLRRPGRGAFGLRGRIVGAVLVTTVATLAVAALAVLGPLEQDLRNNALATLKKDLGRKELPNFKALDPAKLLLSGVSSPPSTQPFRAAQAQKQQLVRLRLTVANRVGVTPSLVNLLGFADPSGKAYLVGLPADNDLLEPDNYGDAAQAFQTGHPVFGFATINDTQYVRAAVPVATAEANQRFVLTVRKPIEDIPGAVHVVRTAFLYAALAGLALTIALGIPLSARLVRRLQRLRQASLEVANAGPTVDVPEDRARDEVGDLSRAFATMQRRLRQQEEARRAFVATASHELRTPLTSLEGMLELLDDDLRQPDPDLGDARALLERARAQSRRLGRLAADLLDLSRIDAEVQLRSEPVELGEIGRAVMAEFELGVEERGIQLVLDDTRGSVWACGDPGSIARILRILLENAVRVSPRGSSVVVRVRGGEQAELCVADQGPGVPPEEREVIFQRFQRGRQTGGQAGFGLGLAIGRELAERMQGRLELEPAAEMMPDLNGATLRLTLPVAVAPKVDSLAVG